VTGAIETNEVALPLAGGEQLFATEGRPRDARGLVVFAHGSGSSRHSPRNRLVAEALHGAGFGTLLLDLLTAREDARDQLTAEYRFDIELLAGRLVAAVRWARARPEQAPVPIGLFGASTGAAAALVAAAAIDDEVAAIVSRGGRPDLAGTALTAVRAPTLLIVGGNDAEVLALNRRAAAQLHAAHELAIVPGATHLFEERGALEAVARLAAGWFGRYLTTSP